MGDPTKSLLVNARIKKVSKKEVNQQGKKSQARKPFVCAEFEQVMRTFESMPCIYLSLFLSTIFCFQYNLISRIDDASKLLKDNISKNPKVEHQQYSICTRLCWGKNVTEERDAPLQIILGASHPLWHTPELHDTESVVGCRFAT